MNDKPWHYVSDEEAAALIGERLIDSTTPTLPSDGGGTNIPSNYPELLPQGSLTPTLPNSPEVQDLLRKLATLTTSNKPHTTKRSTKYPWDLWLNGKLHTAVMGTDFECRPGQFQNMLGNIARNRGLYILSSVQKDKKSIVFQAYGTEEERDAAKYGEYDDGYGDATPEDL
jgi:hypothetical protein